MAEAAPPAASAVFTEEDQSEFIECARYGETADVELFLKDGIDVNITDGAGSTALHKAAANGHVDTVKLLAGHGAKFSTNGSGNTPLHWAALNGQKETVELLLELYDDVIEDVLAKNAFGRSAMTEALNRGHEEIARMILSHKSVAPGGAKGGGAAAGAGGDEGDEDGPVEEETDEEVEEDDEAAADGDADVGDAEDAVGAGAGSALP
jgi:hypothetical protein